jgi:cystine transport system substrate-binding protein
VRQAKSARANLISLTRDLAAREAEARQAQEAAAATAAALEHARAERTAALAQLRARRQANAADASSLDEQARTLASAAPSRSSLPLAPPIGRGKTLTVLATGYALSGTTAMGVPVAWGVVAVDPGVIPLGTSMTIPGYGEGVAADTGGAIVGARIDLWFPTTAEALAWGSRTVTITLH